MTRRAFVTGGTGSIGTAIVRALRQQGLAVRFQFHRNEPAAKALAAETGSESVRMDLRAPLSYPLADVDILVNNAGVLPANDSIEDVNDDALSETLAVNLLAPLRLMKSVIPGMRERGWGRIINIGSIHAHRGVGRSATYGISKHALLGMTRAAAKDLAQASITVNQVDPSAVDSAMIDGLAERVAEAGLTTQEGFMAQIAAAIPAGRLADPREVASAVAYLAGEQSGFVTGTSLLVDGGMTS